MPQDHSRETAHRGLLDANTGRSFSGNRGSLPPSSALKPTSERPVEPLRINFVVD